MAAEGIYRISGNQAEVRDLCRSFVAQDFPLPDSLSVHTVSGALKLYLRELYPPVIPFDFYSTFMATQSLFLFWKCTIIKTQFLLLLFLQIRRTTSRRCDVIFTIRNIAITFAQQRYFWNDLQALETSRSKWNVQQNEFPKFRDRYGTNFDEIESWWDAGPDDNSHRQWKEMQHHEALYWECRFPLLKQSKQSGQWKIKKKKGNLLKNRTPK